MKPDDIPGVKELRQIVAGARRKFKEVSGPLAQTYVAAMHHWDSQKADGVSLEDRLSGLEKTLRVAWPFTRTWHYVCDECSDSGWQHGECVNGSCGRPFRLPQARGDDWTGRGTCSPGHAYVRPCFCAKGRVFSQQLTAQRSGFDAIAKAARTSKPMTRLGR